jgi:drug/metabolite transporter (DMT)-like permease
VNRYASLLLALAATWGASYLFIKVGVDGGLSPAALMAARTLVASLALSAYLGATSGWRQAAADLRAAWRPSLVLGALNAALPFWLVAWGETRIDSGVAAIAQATVPLCSLLIGLRFLPHERIGALRSSGVLLGLAGVAVLAGVHPAGGWSAVAGTLAIVLSSISYASAGIFGQLRVQGTPGPVLATGSMIAGFLLLLPVALLQLPSGTPTRGAIASLLALGLLGTAAAQLVLFRILARWGARRLSLVTFLMPGFALVYGALVLGEPVRATALGGLALILVGVALGSGIVRRPPARELGRVMLPGK